jgi:hypothetical protein
MLLTFYQLTVGLQLAKAKSHHLICYVTDSTLTVIELTQMKKNHENKMLVCKGDLLTALIVSFYYNLVDISNLTNDSYLFLTVISPIMVTLTQCYILVKSLQRLKMKILSDIKNNPFACRTTIKWQQEQKYFHDI